MKLTIELELSSGKTVRLTDQEGKELQRILHELYAPKQMLIRYEPETNEPWLATLNEEWLGTCDEERSGFSRALEQSGLQPAFNPDGAGSTPARAMV